MSLLLLLLLLLLLIKKRKREREGGERLKALATEKFKEKLFPEAIKYFNEACHVIYSKGDDDSDPTRLGFYVICKSNMAQCYINLGNFELAIRLASDALLKDPSNVKALYRRGTSYLASNQFGLAFIDFESCQALDPDNKSLEKEVKKAASLCLLSVIKSGDLKIITRLLKSGADIHFKRVMVGALYLQHLVMAIQKSSSIYYQKGQIKMALAHYL